MHGTLGRALAAAKLGRAGDHLGARNAGSRLWRRAIGIELEERYCAATRGLGIADGSVLSRRDIQGVSKRVAKLENNHAPRGELNLLTGLRVTAGASGLVAHDEVAEAQELNRWEEGWATCAHRPKPPRALRPSRPRLCWRT
jgi:hypothetical protein